MKTLSIIVPCYNSENTLSKTLDSLNLKKNGKRMEVFLIDDGSIDETFYLMKNWEKKFPKTIKIIRKNNGNWGSVINIAKQHVSGKYVKILDSDDTFYTDEIVNYLDRLDEIEEDVVFTNFYFYNEGKNKWNKNSLTSWFNFTQKILRSEFKKIGKKRGTRTVTMHSIACKKEIFKKIGELPEKNFYTDSILVHKIIKNSKTFAYIPHLYLYIYHVGQEGQSINISNFVKNGSHVNTVFYHLINHSYVNNNKKHNSWTSSLIRGMFKLKLLIFSVSMMGDEKEKKNELLNDLLHMKKNMARITYITTMDTFIRFILWSRTYIIFDIIRYVYKKMLNPFIKGGQN